MPDVPKGAKIASVEKHWLKQILIPCPGQAGSGWQIFMEPKERNKQNKTITKLNNSSMLKPLSSLPGDSAFSEDGDTDNKKVLYTQQH